MNAFSNHCQTGVSFVGRIYDVFWIWDYIAAHKDNIKITLLPRCELSVVVWGSDKAIHIAIVWNISLSTQRQPLITFMCGVCVCVCSCRWLCRKVILVEVAELHFLLHALHCVSPTCTAHTLRFVLLSVFSVCPCCVHLISCVLLLMFAFRQNDAFCDLFHPPLLCELLRGKQWTVTLKLGFGNAGGTRQRRLYFESIPPKNSH